MTAKSNVVVIDVSRSSADESRHTSNHEFLFCIMRLLDWKTLLRKCSKVSRAWNEAASDERLWMWLVLSHWKVTRLQTRWKEEFQQRLIYELNLDRGIATVTRLKGHKESVTCVEMEGDVIATASDDGTARTWYIGIDGNIQQLKKFEISGEKITCMSMSRIHNVMMCGTEDGSICGWQLSSAEKIPGLCLHLGTAISSIIFNDIFAGVTARDAAVRIFQLVKPCFFTALAGHRAAVYTIDIADGIVATGGRDTEVRIWDLQKIHETVNPIIQICKGHTASVTAVRIHIRNNMVVSGSDDTSVYVWDTLTGARIWELLGHKGPISCIEFGNFSK